MTKTLRRKFTRRERRGGSVRGSRHFRRFQETELQRYLHFWKEVMAAQVLRESAFFKVIRERIA